MRARAGLGMQITGATPVIWSDVWADGLTLVNIDDRIVPGYRVLAAAVHAEGGLMLAQLAHVGAMETAGDAIVSASGARSEITQRTARARPRPTNSPRSWKPTAPQRAAAAKANSTASR